VVDSKGPKAPYIHNGGVICHSNGMIWRRLCRNLILAWGKYQDGYEESLGYSIDPYCGSIGEIGSPHISIDHTTI